MPEGPSGSRAAGAGQLLLACVCGAALGAAAVWHTPERRAPPASSEQVLAVLRSEPVALLVVQRGAAQVVVEHRQSDWLGQWHAVLWTSVRWSWGMDLEQVTAQDVRREGDVVVVRLPEPQVLDFGLVPGSTGFLSKSSAVPRLQDLLGDQAQRRQLEQRVHEEALQFMQRQDLAPGRAEIVRRLNDAAGLLEARAGVRLRFE